MGQSSELPCPRCSSHRRYRIPSPWREQQVPLHGPPVVGVLATGAGESLSSITVANSKLINGLFSPPSRPHLPVRPQMPGNVSLTLRCGMRIAAQNNVECALPSGLVHQYSADYMDKTRDACLMVVHYRGELNLATRSTLTKEVFDRFGVALADDESRFLNSLVRALPPPPPTDSVAMSGAQVLKAAPKVSKSSKKLHDCLKEHTDASSPSPLPDRQSWPMVPWAEHWEAYAPNDNNRWTLAGRLVEDRYDSFDNASEEEQAQIRADLEAWVLQDTDAIFEKGCEHPGNCDYAAMTYNNDGKGKKINHRRPPRGLQCPYATQAGEARVLCGSHWQQAWAAFKLLGLTWCQYKRYGSKVREFASLTKPCEGSACNNTSPPHIRLPPSHCCGGMGLALCTSCQSSGQTSKTEQEKKLNTEERYILHEPESRYLLTNLPCADEYKNGASCLGSAR